MSEESCPTIYSTKYSTPPNWSSFQRFSESWLWTNYMPNPILATRRNFQVEMVFAQKRNYYWEIIPSHCATKPVAMEFVQWESLCQDQIWWRGKNSQIEEEVDPWSNYCPDPTLRFLCIGREWQGWGQSSSCHTDTVVSVRQDFPITETQFRWENWWTDR